MIEVVEQFLEHRVVFWTLALVTVALAALRWGAGPERLSAIAILYVLIADRAYHLVFGPGVRLVTIDVGHAFIDLSVAAAMLGIALFANRMYTLWIGALQVVAVQAHIARDMVPQIAPLAYAILYIAPSYFQIGLLAAGLWSHQKRLRTYGSYKSWRTSLPRLWGKGPLAWLSA